MTKRAFTTFLITLATIVAAVPLSAQDDSPALRERVRLEIEQTDRLIERAEELLQASGSPASLNLLEQAQTLQLRAKDELSAEHFLVARRLTLQARELLRRALTTGRQTEQGEELVLRKLEQTGEKLDRAAEIVEEANNPALDAMYQSARDNLKRAWEFYDGHQYEPALKLVELVDRTADRILGNASRPKLDANYERRRETVREALERARELIAECPSSKSQRLLEHAQKAFELSEELAAKKRFQAALQALQRAREAAQRATLECRGSSDLQARHQRLTNQTEQLRERALTLSGERRTIVDRLLVQAHEQLDLAQAHLQEGNVERCQAAIQAAQLALRQAESQILDSQ